MAPEEEHHVFVDSGGSAIPAFGPDSVAVEFEIDLAPSIGDEVESVKVIAVVAVVTSEDVHGVLVNDGRVTVSG